MAIWRRFAGTGKPDTCLWCGRALRQKYHIETEPTGKLRPPTRCVECAPATTTFLATDSPQYYQCRKCGTETRATPTRRIVSREKWLDGRGDYGDGFFCNLRCAHSFAVQAAQTGTRLTGTP